MKSNSLFSNAVKNPVSTIIIVLIVLAAGFEIYLNVSGVQEATDSYAYYKSLTNLIKNGCRYFFMFIFLVMCYLNYIQKQYSKWTIRLFYVIGVTTFLYFMFANQWYEYVFRHVEVAQLAQMPRLAQTLYTAPIVWIVIIYLLIPRILKDAQRLKQEHDLTI